MKKTLLIFSTVLLALFFAPTLNSYALESSKTFTVPSNTYIEYIYDNGNSDGFINFNGNESTFFGMDIAYSGNMLYFSTLEVNPETYRCNLNFVFVSDEPITCSFGSLQLDNGLYYTRFVQSRGLPATTTSYSSNFDYIFDSSEISLGLFDNSNYQDFFNAIGRSDYLFGDIDFENSENYIEDYSFIDFKSSRLDSDISINFDVTWNDVNRPFELENIEEHVLVEATFTNKNNPSDYYTEIIGKDYLLKSMHVNCGVIIDSSDYYLSDISFTPYYFYNENNILKFGYGRSEILYFNSDNSVDITKMEELKLNNLFLTNVKINTIFDTTKISWNGVNDYSYLAFVPDDDANVHLMIKATDSFGNFVVNHLDLTNLSTGSFSVKMDDIMNTLKNDGYSWDYKFYLQVTFIYNNKYYMSGYTIIDTLNDYISNSSYNDDGTASDNIISDLDGTGSDTSILPSFDLGNSSGLFNMFTSTLKSLLSSLGQLPQLFASVFSFMPSYFFEMISYVILFAIVLRLLGR